MKDTNDACDVSTLRAEYDQLIGAYGTEDLQRNLVLDHDWSRAGACEVVQLAETKGVFLLRNALALALSMGIHDGDQGI